MYYSYCDNMKQPKIWNVGSLGNFVETEDGEYRHFRNVFVSRDSIAFEDNVGEIVYITDTTPHMLAELRKVEENIINLSTEAIGSGIWKQLITV